QAIVEEKDATPAQRQIQEIYSGIMAVPTRLLRAWLARLDNHNAQQEYYLTDVVKFAVADGYQVQAHCISDAWQVEGVNNPVQLASLECAYQHMQAQRLMLDGVRLADPARFDLRGSLICGQDVEIDVNCVFEGHVSLGDGVRIGPNCVIANANIGAGTFVQAFSHIDGEQQGVTTVTLGTGGTIGGGSTITKDTPAGALTVARGKQTSIANWQRPTKTKK
ncbi:MAG: hypothetical protein EB066_08535, partial [Betaproteobacteria bacterium]|nr:hypothetical protein [Betaproteobacteria bacterium]